MEKIKRRLIATFMFDFGFARNAMYTPTISVYWILSEKEKPVKFSFKYAWQDFEINMSYDHFMNLDSLIKHAAYEFDRRINKYDGKYLIDVEEHFHLSEFGKTVMASSSQKQVEGWLETWRKENEAVSKHILS